MKVYKLYDFEVGGCIGTYDSKTKVNAAERRFLNDVDGDAITWITEKEIENPKNLNIDKW